jgi:hypothetical protein
MRPGRLFLRWRSATAALSLHFGMALHMTTSEHFTPPIPDPEEAPRPPTHRRPPAEKTGKPILIPRKTKATFQWPPDCLWPFNETIGHHGWDSDA